MRQVDHFIVGGAGGSAGRTHQIWNPSTGEMQAEVALGDAALLDRAVANRKGGPARMGRDQSAETRPRDVPLQGIDRGQYAGTGRTACPASTAK